MRVSVDLDLCQGHGGLRVRGTDRLRARQERTVTILDEYPRRARFAPAVESCRPLLPHIRTRITEEE